MIKKQNLGQKTSCEAMYIMPNCVLCNWPLFNIFLCGVMHMYRISLPLLHTSSRHRVAAYSGANKMPAASLAKVFGPTIVGHGCANPEPAQMWQDTQKQPKVT